MGEPPVHSTDVSLSCKQRFGNVTVTRRTVGPCIGGTVEILGLAANLQAQSQAKKPFLYRGP